MNPCPKPKEDSHPTLGLREPKAFWEM